MKRSVLTTILVSGLMAVAGAADWPAYLGAKQDGYSAETGWRTNWDDEEPVVLWKAELGKGMASFVVADGLAITTGNVGDRDTVWCFDVKSGELKWKHVYDEDLAPKYYEGGTSATPTISDGRVYAASKSGKLNCLDLKSGDVVWKVDYVADLDGKHQTWGWAAAPRVVGDFVLADPGAKGRSVVALDKRTGKAVWESGTAQPGYCAPVVYEHAGEDAVAYFHGKTLAGYRLKDGKELFEIGWKTKYDVNASPPLFRDGRFFVSSGYGTGAGGIDLTGVKARVAWTDKELQLQFQNALLVDDGVVAMFGDKGKLKGNLCWVDHATGKVSWSAKLGGDRGTVLMVGGKLIVFTERGELVVGEASKSGFEEISRAQVLSKTCWAAPAFSDGMILVRNNAGKAVCLDVSK